MGKGTVAGRRITKAERKGEAGRRLSKGAVAAVIASALALQPCFSFISLAYPSLYGGGYGYEMDDAGDYYYGENGERVYVTNVTKTYEDGTRYVAEYQYDSQKRLVAADIKREDGSKSTERLQYIEDRLASVSAYYYDASTKEEVNVLNEYNEQEMPLHSVTKKQYPDGTAESSEEWYQGQGKPIKIVTVDQKGVTEQTDYAYDGYGNLTMEKTVASDGSRDEREYQYEGTGEVIYQKVYSYDSSTQTSYTKEAHYGKDEPGQSGYTVETETASDGRERKTETWLSVKWEKITKRVITDYDGSQVTEDYTYNSEGRETLYVMSDSDGMIARRETTIREDGETEVLSDREGNVHTISERYDERTNQKTNELKFSYADGSYQYVKETYDADSYLTISKITEERTADGKKTYTEQAYNEYGQVVAAKIQDPEGVESQSAYEYDEAGELVKGTETKENGISVITQYQIRDGGGGWRSAARTFSNGYQMTVVEEDIDANTARYTYTYSAGDVAQDIMTLGEDIVSVTTIYRDGRTEEASGGYDEWDELLSKAQAHYDDFDGMAWGMTSVQAEAAVAGLGEPDLGRGLLFDLRQE